MVAVLQSNPLNSFISEDFLTTSQTAVDRMLRENPIKHLAINVEMTKKTNLPEHLFQKTHVERDGELRERMVISCTIKEVYSRVLSHIHGLDVKEYDMNQTINIITDFISDSNVFNFVLTIKGLEAGAGNEHLITISHN